MINYNKLYESGKLSDKILHHGYHRIYPWFLNHFQDVEKLNIMEIGVDQSNSVKMWLNFFKNPNIVVMDIEIKMVEKARFIKLDQSNEVELNNYAINNLAIHDIILDDGSHVPDHQLKTLIHFWKTLKPGGIYIIEDIETSFWGKSNIYGYKFNASKNNFFKKILNSVEIVNFEFFKSKKLKLNNIELIMKDVEMVTFSYNSIILVKKHADFIEYYNRDYRFKNKINEDSFLNLLIAKFKRLFLNV
jgi:hypothetical protein